MTRSFSIIVVLATFLLCGCDNKLEITPKGKIILTTVDEYATLLDGISSDYDLILPVSASFDGAIFEADILENYSIIDKANYLGLEDIDRRLDFKTDLLYNACYNRIATYNIIIDNIMKASGGDEATKLRTIAEAKVFRAYNHFILVNTFCKHYNSKTANQDGGIQIRSKFSLEESPEQLSVASVYKSIEDDINASIPQLNAEGKNINHPGLAFAYALKAKVHLFKGEFSEAEKAATESLKYNGYIFDMVAWDNEAKPVSKVKSFLNKENLYYAVGNGYYQIYNLGIGPNLNKKFTNGDLRKKCFFSTLNPWLVPGSYSYSGYRDTVNGKITQRYFSYNASGMKVSEVVLMLAECYARKGDVNGAMQLVNNLRKKRISPNTYTDLTANSKEEAFWVVMDERSRELALTPNNFFDIRRLEAEGIHQSVVRELSTGDKYTVNSSSSIFTMPFAQTAIDGSKGKLKQNVNH